MKPHKKIQNIQIAGKVLRTPGESIIVDSADITKGVRSWDGKLIRIRPLRNGKSQILRLA